MAIWYKTYSDNIYKVNIIKETDKFVYLIENKREAKNTEWNSYHKTFNEAKLYLIKKQQKVIDKILFNLQYARKKLHKMKSISINNIKDN